MEESPIKPKAETPRQINDPGRVEDIVKELVDNLKKVTGFLITHGVDINIAEDIAQEAFLRAQKAAPNFRGGSEVLTWQVRIAQNLYVDMMRAGKPRSKVFQKISDEDWRNLIEHTSDSSQGAATPADQLSSKEEVSRINAAIEKLTTKQQEVIKARAEGQEYLEIANALKIPVGTVMSRLYDARKRLSKNLEDESLG